MLYKAYADGIDPDAFDAKDFCKMTKTYDLAVFIGRFCPWHRGHQHVVDNALGYAQNVLILVGSARSPRSHRVPFTFQERRDMIENSQLQADRGRVMVMPLEDSTYNDARWIQHVQNSVAQAQARIGQTPATGTVTLIGHSRDHSSYYLKLFPQWDNIEVPSFQNISGTNIRNSYFSNMGHMWVQDADGHKPGDLPRDALVSTPVQQFLAQFLNTDDYKNILEEYEFVLKYKAAWQSAPYPPVFVTVDAVVVQSGHVLLVRRGARPGKGQWAMPGGFINQFERIEDAMLRELREETQLRVPEPVLRGSIVSKEVFDDPNRSSRGRTITHCYLIKLRDDTALPRVKGADDADKALWIPISELRPEDHFEDHYHVIQAMLARI
jgi:bifunctional NMN adenylyltransferase/nudix hydrolase